MQRSCEAAFSQVDITPDYPVQLIGRYRPDPSSGVLHRLYAQALLFRRGTELFCLVTIDSLGLTVPLANGIRSQIAALLGTTVPHVMLNFSHTHSAPEPTPFSLNGERYYNFLCDQITSCVQNAKDNFRACKIGWALTTAIIGANRRKGGAALDNRVGALMVTEADSEKQIALMVRIAAHPNILPTENLRISGDFIAVAREALQRSYGPTVLFLQGAAGNIKAAGTNEIGEGSDEVLRAVADELVHCVKRLRFTPQDVASIQMFSTHIGCVSDVPTKEKAAQTAGDNPSEDGQNWIRACLALRESGIKTQRTQVEINFLRLNEGCVCGVADELFCESALDAWERTQNPLFFLNGYTNGCTGYLPSRIEWHKGGYEVVDSYFAFHAYSGRVAPYRADTADRIVDAVVAEYQERITAQDIPQIHAIDRSHMQKNIDNHHNP